MLKPQEIRKLLKSFNTLQTYRVNLDKAIEYERSKSSDDIITAMMLSQNIGGMPFPPIGSVSNKTADIAQSYMSRAEQELKSMEQGSQLIKHILNQLEYAVNSLNTLSQKIITRLFFEDAKCSDLVTILGGGTQQRDERTIRRIVNRALLKIATLVTISTVDYYYIINHERLHS